MHDHVHVEHGRHGDRPRDVDALGRRLGGRSPSQTDGIAPNSADAVKTFVDANIQIAPLTDNNPVSTNHTLTGHVNVNAGSGAGYVNAPAGTVISFALVNSGGASAAFVGPASCTVATGGSCIRW